MSSVFLTFSAKSRILALPMCSLTTVECVPEVTGGWGRTLGKLGFHESGGCGIPELQHAPWELAMCTRCCASLAARFVFKTRNCETVCKLQGHVVDYPNRVRVHPHAARSSQHNAWMNWKYCAQSAMCCPCTTG